MQYAFHIQCGSNFLSAFTVSHLIKEACRRQLLGISHNNCSFTSHECSQCIFRFHLTCFIKNNDIKLQFRVGRVQILCNGQWTHHKDWLDFLYGSSGLFKQSSNWQMSAFSCKFSSKYLCFRIISSTINLWNLTV